ATVTGTAKQRMILQPSSELETGLGPREYLEDREYADFYLPQQMEIIARVAALYNLQIADYQQDTEESSDLVWLSGPNNHRIALRVRRPGYYQKFGLRDFTVRFLRYDTGAKTEHQKFLEGMGDWFGYFHVSKNDELEHWLVIDLQGWRCWLKTISDPG